MTALLEARNVSKQFGGGIIDKSHVLALDEVSFRISGETPTVISIVGESGSGKTTLARILLGLVSPTSGQVLYQGADLQKLTTEQRRAFLRDVQVIFQDPFEVYNPFYRVDHVLELPIKNFGLAKGRRDRIALIEEVLQTVGLRPEETLGRYPHQLSGGQRQRIMVARALLLRPKVIIADEPVSMVDASLRATILGSLRKLNQDFGISIVYITHDLTTAYQISEEMMVLYRGSTVEAGDAEAVVQQPRHPYTQLLVGSIPLPDPGKDWQGEHALGEPAAGVAPTGESYCRFYDRCPHAMPICVEQAPPLFLPGPEQATACYLYREAPVISAAELAERLGGTPAPAAPPEGTQTARRSREVAD